MKLKGLKIGLSIAMGIIALFLSLMLAFNIVYIKTRAEGESMYPTLNSTAGSDRVFINRFESGEVGDIVVANISKQENWEQKQKGDYAIKRLIAKEGDRVRIEQAGVLTYSLIVNDKVIETKKLTTEFNSYYYFNIYIATNYLNPEKVENGNMVVGIGEIFLMGDNWENSYDCASCGPISVTSLVGRVDIVVPRSKNIFLGTIKGIFKMWFK